MKTSELTGEQDGLQILAMDPEPGEARADYLARAVETAQRWQVKVYVEWNERVATVTPTSTVIEVSRQLQPVPPSFDQRR